MSIIKPSVDFFGPLPTDRESTIKFIEKAGRTCYKSEDKITSDSAEKFVKKLIKAGHLAMVEHSNFVVKSTTPGFLLAVIGKYLNIAQKNDTVYVGGNLTAWHQLKNCCVQSNDLLFHFRQTYGDLFGKTYTGLRDISWQICPFDEIPEELHRYSARFICDRGVSHELVRHRPCSFAQESTRYVNYAGKDIEFIEPAGYGDWPDYLKMIFATDLTRDSLSYDYYINHGLSPQQARAVLPNALKTELIVTADLAEWVHIFKLRCHKSAHPDMVKVMTMLRDKFVEGGIINE